jgi:hypothetical protein
MKKGIIIIGSVILLIPFILNWVMRWTQIVPYVGEAKDWLGFWGSYLSAAAAAIMIIFTYYSLKNNKETLNEMKKEWEEERKANLYFSIEDRIGLFVLKVANIGKSPAYNVRLKFNKEFINALLFNQIKDVYRTLPSKSFSLENGKAKYFYISPIYGNSICEFKKTHETFTGEEINNWLNKFRYVPIIIDATFGKKDTAHAEITLDNFLVSSLVIKDDITEQLEKMAKEMVRSNDSIYTIQKTLDIIARHIEQK